MKKYQIIGAGIAGLMAAITLAENKKECNLISLQASERAQSVLAEGGINAALDTMGENDSPKDHYNDTMRGGCFLADPAAVKNLTDNAPDIVRKFEKLGVPFNRINGDIALRHFGGQKKMRTAYAKDSTGKVLVSALIAEVRKYEASGLIKRYCNHSFEDLIIQETDPETGNSRESKPGQTGKKTKCIGVIIRDIYTGEVTSLYGNVLLAAGGMNGLFPGMTTGTTQNNACVQDIIFSRGVEMANLEMIQYHPTTIGLPDKRSLVTEAARAAGGRLYAMKDGKKCYFMEEKYPELGNLMPRDVVSREISFVMKDPAYEGKVFLDITGIPEAKWNAELADLRAGIIYYMGIDPKDSPVPVEPGIHYFMGGIYVNEKHETSLEGLYAAGECACQYHGANRLGGNSLLGAAYGGKKAAEQMMAAEQPGMVKKQGIAGENITAENAEIVNEKTAVKKSDSAGNMTAADSMLAGASESILTSAAYQNYSKDIGNVLRKSLDIVRSEKEIREGMSQLGQIEKRLGKENSPMIKETVSRRLRLAEAMLLSADMRKESRGAHYRSDYPESKDEYLKTTVAIYRNGKVEIELRAISL